MNNYIVCLFDKDIHYATAFMKVVAVEHTGYSVGTRSECGEGCSDEFDVCIGFGICGSARASCEKAFEPGCGRYGGVAAILSEARKFIIDRSYAYGNTASNYSSGTGQEIVTHFNTDALVCVHSFAGGLGTSCAAIGIGRELARYRGEQVVYLSLEDAEDAGLCPVSLRAMRAEEALYRYLRLINTGTGQEGFGRLFGAAFARDEYGLFRLAPDETTNSLASLAPGELYLFLKYVYRSLALGRIVLDFGTRLNYLKQFAAFPAGTETLFIEVRQEGSNDHETARALFIDDNCFAAAFNVCDEDIRRQGGYTEVGIANSFGLSVKETCDRILGDRL